jgi:sulfur carrier protein
LKTIRINGEARSLAASTVPEMIAEIGLPPEMLLIEHNGIALHRSEWPTTMLAEGDQVEILRVAAGG